MPDLKREYLVIEESSKIDFQNKLEAEAGNGYKLDANIGGSSQLILDSADNHIYFVVMYQDVAI